METGQNLWMFGIKARNHDKGSFVYSDDRTGGEPTTIPWQPADKARIFSQQNIVTIPATNLGTTARLIKNVHGDENRKWIAKVLFKLMKAGLISEEAWWNWTDKHISNYNPMTESGLPEEDEILEKASGEIELSAAHVTDEELEAANLTRSELSAFQESLTAAGFSLKDVAISRAIVKVPVRPQSSAEIMTARLSAAGASTARPSTARPSTARPSTARPSTAGASTAGSSIGGPSRKGASAANPSLARSSSSAIPTGSLAAGALASGSISADPLGAGVSATARSATRQSAAGQSAAGQSAACLPAPRPLGPCPLAPRPSAARPSARHSPVGIVYVEGLPEGLSLAATGRVNEVAEALSNISFGTFQGMSTIYSEGSSEDFSSTTSEASSSGSSHSSASRGTFSFTPRAPTRASPAENRAVSPTLNTRRGPRAKGRR
jgi:hypothetical protein